MIQRMQTVWLLLAMACEVLLLYFPVWQLAEGSSSKGMDIIGAGTHLYLLGFPPVLFITHAIAIFSFKKRKRQMQLCNINILLFILFLIVALIVIQIEDEGLKNFQAGSFKVGALLPVFGIIFNFIARGRIKKDEDLIRSMDRLR